MKKIIFTIISILIIIPTILPLFNSSFFIVHDNTQIERVYEMTISLRNGDFPVRWVENLGYGYGYPIFNFYAPLPYYIGGFVNLLVGNALIATKIMFMIGIILSFITMFIFAKRLSNSYAALAAATIYLYFPYHAVNIYIRGAVGEYFAYAFFPLVLLGIYELYKRSDKKIPILASSISSFALFFVVVSHNLSAFMVTLILIPYVVWLVIFSKNKINFLVALLVMSGLSFLLSAFFVLPAILESGYTNVSSQIGGGADYRDHFLCIGQLWNSPWGFGGSIPGCEDGLSFRLGKLNIILVVGSLIFAVGTIIRKRKIQIDIIYLVLLAFSIFLLIPISAFIWENTFYMEYLQYPWRFLNLAGLFIAVVCARLLFRIKNTRYLIGAVSVIVVISIFYNFKLFVPTNYENKDTSFYESSQHIQWETSKISDEYLPKNFDKPKDKTSIPSQLVTLDDKGITIESINFEPGYLSFEKKGQSGKIHINKAYFPSWKAYIDGEKVRVEEDPKGMTIEVPEGDMRVELKFENTMVQYAGNTLSLVGIITIIVVIIVKKKK